MPVWTFKDKTRGDDPTFPFTGTIAEMEQSLKDNPNMVWVPAGAPPIFDSVRLGRKKPDEGFKDILRQVKKKNPRSTVNTF